MEAAGSLAKHGKSFHWASRFLDASTARDAALLYAFCREADDLADEGCSSLSRRETAELLSEFDALSRRRGFDPAVIEVFLGTLRSDSGSVRIRTHEELLRYCYGVASTVGLMMCDVLGVHDARARAFAIDLGIAMQLTNIARDVLEDARRDRIYLPMPDDIGPAEILAGDPRTRRIARAEVDKALALARRYYRSGDRGMRFLPRRARVAILIASRVYEAIGGVIQRRRGDRYWAGRCWVGRAGKLLHTVRALGSLLFQPRFWRSRSSDPHDCRLHLGLRGLPHTTVAA